MLQFFLELIIAILAVYGAYAALHQLAALLDKLIGTKSVCQDRGDRLERKGKEDSHGGESESESGRPDHIGRDD